MHSRPEKGHHHAAPLWREQQAANARLSQLAEAPDRYASVLKDKERHLVESGDPRRARLLELADERGRLTAEMRELTEAEEAARTASHALLRVREKLDKATGWATLDGSSLGGAFTSWMKYPQLDMAAVEAAYADECLAVLRTEFADIDDAAPVAPSVEVDAQIRFIDVWLDNPYTDYAVRHRIKESVQSVEQSARLVSEAHDRLDQRMVRTRERLTAIETERRDLLARS